ncbi:MAG: hypothetical protein NC041_01660 [Bacteroides sp.]|nr:hypothetical protein [Prevotella sp.]MCM1407690.1 hypothetical protein [Treponema brennaborense]MCM1469160.1 hypothetical protein [Bacteroides sp.]
MNSFSHYSQYPKISKILNATDDDLTLLFDNSEKRIFSRSTLNGKKNYAALAANAKLFKSAQLLLDGLALQWNPMLDISATFVYDNSTTNSQ